MISFEMQSTVHIVFYKRIQKSRKKARKAWKPQDTSCCHGIVAFLKNWKIEKQKNGENLLVECSRCNFAFIHHGADEKKKKVCIVRQQKSESNREIDIDLYVAK